MVQPQLLLLLAVAVMHAMLIHAGWHGSPGARTSVELLLQTFYAKWFWGLVAAAGGRLWAPRLQDLRDADDPLTEEAITRALKAAGSSILNALLEQRETTSRSEGPEQ